MCTRYSFTVNKETVQQRFNLEEEDDAYKTSYNVSARQEACVISNEVPSKITTMIWGLIPEWSNEGLNNGKLINARIEGIGGSSSFRIPIRQRRCLVLADSYYEWEKRGLKKWPHRVIYPEQELMVLAGVWDIWKREGEITKSFSIITRPAFGKLKRINDRMPLVLKNTALQLRWLEDINLKEVYQIARESESVDLKCYPISPKINIIGFNSKELHEERAS